MTVLGSNGKDDNSQAVSSNEYFLPALQSLADYLLHLFLIFFHSFWKHLIYRIDFYFSYLNYINVLLYAFWYFHIER